MIQQQTHFETASLEIWEDQVFRAAVFGGYFTTWRGTRRGRKFLKKEFGDFASAALDAYHDPKALVYAVTHSGRSTCLVRNRWPHFLELVKEWAGEKARVVS